MEELIEKSKKGDKEAFTQLIVSLEKDLYKIARSRLSCEDDISEAIQETMIETFKYIKKIRKPQCFKTWVIKVLVNKCNKIYKKKQKLQLVEYSEDIEDNMFYDDNSNTLNLDFYLLIEKLNYNERIVLILYYLEDLTTKEISKILKEPESTIRNRISRAKIKLKRDINIKEDFYNG